MAVRQTPSRLLSLARPTVALVSASAQVRTRGKARASGTYTRGEFGGVGWVRIGGVMPFFLRVFDGVVSTPAISVELILWF